MNRRILLPVLLIAGVAAAVASLWAATNASDDSAIPSLQNWAGALVLSGGAMFTSGRAWSSLLAGRANDRSLIGALYVSQLAKYLPGGGVLQAAGAVGLSTGDDVSTARAAVAVPVSSLLTVAACGVIGAGTAIVGSGAADWIRWLSLLGLLGPILLHRPIMVEVVRALRRVSKRFPAPDTIPSQPRILRGAAWTSASMLCTSLSFGVLVDPLVDPGVPELTTTFALAWMLGYVIVPLPGGLGVREAALVGLLGGSAVPVVAGSVLHRIVIIAAELTIVAGHLVTVAVSSRRQHSTTG